MSAYIKKRYFRLFLVLIFTGLTACDAPRENPLDPSSPYYTRTKTLFMVRHLSPIMPGGIAYARIMLPELGLYAVSDAQGNVQIEHQRQDSLLIITQAQGYFPDTSKVDGSGKTETITIRLNAKPEVNDIDFHSLYENFPGFPSITSASFTAAISDMDGQDDISLMVLRCAERNFADTLKLIQGESNLYSSNFRMEDVDPGLQPGDFPELNFTLIVKNSNGDSLRRGPFSVTRVIAENIELLTPVNASTVQDTVHFSWRPVNLNYDFTYSLLLIRLQDNHTDVFSGISAEDSTFTIANLIPGMYLWQLKILDKSGDLCHSNSIYFYFIFN